MKRFLLVVAALPFILFLGGCGHEIQGGLSQSEAQEIVSILRESKIDAHAEADKNEAPGSKEGAAEWRVVTSGSADQAIRAWQVMSDHGYPKKHDPGIKEWLERQQGGLALPDATDKMASLVSAKGGDLSNELRSMPEVVDAQVSLVILTAKEAVLDSRDEKPPTASVVLRYRGEHSPFTEDEIRDIVAKGGVAGLSPSNVAVIQKRVPERPLPPEEKFGPLNGGEWMALSALTLSGVSGAGALSMLVLSKRRGLRIKMLERQLAQGNDGSGLRLEGNA